MLQKWQQLVRIYSLVYFPSISMTFAPLVSRQQKGGDSPCSSCGLGYWHSLLSLTSTLHYWYSNPVVCIRRLIVCANSLARPNWLCCLAVWVVDTSLQSHILFHDSLMLFVLKITSRFLSQKTDAKRISL